MSRPAVAPIAALILLLAASAALSYSGSLTTPDGTTGGLRGTGDWWPVTISWDVTWTGTAWKYVYDVSNGGQRNISHFIVEASDDFRVCDILASNWPADNIVVGSAAPGSPQIPEDMWSIRFNTVTGLPSWHIEFTTLRMPIWGDCYVKNGNVPGGEGIVETAWNEGFLRADPAVAPHDGTEDNHILRPDTIVPEPGSVVALLVGLAGLAVRRRR